MKAAKKFLLLALTLAVLLCGTVIFAHAAGNGPDFGVVATVGESQVQIDQWVSGDKAYLFLPSDADASDLTVHTSADGAVSLNGTALADGDKIALAQTELNKIM